MPGRKKKFSCGHTGKGKYCHRCKHEAELNRSSKKIKQEWDDQLSAMPISLDHVPEKIAKKTIQIINKLSSGENYQLFRGKRLAKMGQRQTISIPIGRRYRLICSENKGIFTYIEVISHENYNIRLSSGGWITNR